MKKVFWSVNKLGNELGTKTRINIELKSNATAEPVAKILDKYLKNGLFQYENIIISSFRHNELEIFHKLIPNIDIAVLIDDDQWIELNQDCKEAIKLTKLLHGVSLNPSISFVNIELIKEAHENNIEINVWTIRNQNDYDRIKELGVDGIFTNTLNLEFG